MEFKPEFRNKHRNELLLASSDSSITSSSNSSRRSHPFSSNRKKRKQPENTKNDTLLKHFEKKKLKDKSLSEKMKTPFDRKLYRTCWPVELGKVSRIKKKPREKRREKPSHKSLTRRKLPKPTCSRVSLDLNKDNIPEYKRNSPAISCSELEFLDDDSFSKVFRCINKRHFLYEQVTPEMLMNALQHPDHIKNGATIDMIISKLRALNVDLNPSLEELREEILLKLLCAIKLGLVVEDDGYYRIADEFISEKLSKEKINAVWALWYKRMTKVRRKQ